MNDDDIQTAYRTMERALAPTPAASAVVHRTVAARQRTRRLILGLGTLGVCASIAATAAVALTPLGTDTSSVAVTASSLPPDNCANVAAGPLGPVQEVIRVEQVSGADVRTWIRARGDWSARVALPEGLSGLQPNEPVTICVVSVDGMAPPGPPLPNGGPPPPADTVAVITRADGSMTVETIGPRSSVLAGLESLPSSS